MILIVTNREDQTADFLILELKKRKHRYIRFNTEDYPNIVTLTWKIQDGVINGYLNFPKWQIDLHDIKSVWYRRPVSPKLNLNLEPLARDFVIEESRTALEGLWRTLSCFWVSKPDNIRVAENKIYQLKVASEIGFQIWPTTVTNNKDTAMAFYEESKRDIVYKPLRKGRLIRDDKQSFIFTNIVKNGTPADFEKVQYAPCLFQKYIHKKMELRVTVIGEKVFSVSIDSQKDPEAVHDWRRSQDNLIYKKYKLPADLENNCLELVKKLGLEFGAIDLIVTPNDEFVFVEINPNGQWAWIQQLLPDIPMRETLADLLIDSETKKE